MIALAIRLWRIFYPAGVVFDEVYFGNFTNYYIKSQFYYDIHPPLGKILAAVMANLSEYDGSINFEKCPNGLYPIPDYVMLRLTPAILSALCGPMAYLAVRFAGFSEVGATVAAVLTIFDTSLGTEGRHILSDGILHFFSILHIAILTFTMSIRKRNKLFVIWHLVTAISLGAACACKNTAWGLMLMDAVCYGIRLLPYLRCGILDYLFELCLWGGPLAIIQLLVYLTVFSIHFILLPYSGPGFGYLKQPMKDQMIPEVVGEAGLWGMRLKSPGLFSRSAWITMDMHKGNMGIQEFHSSMSLPAQWPIPSGIMAYFWARDGREIRCMANVFSYCFAFAGVVATPFGIRKGQQFLNALMFFAGWCACYLPFFLIPRIMYTYHYCIPLIIGCMSCAASMDMFLQPRIKPIVAVVVIALTIFGFWLWSPYTYGTPLHDKEVTLWSNRWIDGDDAYRSRRTAHEESKRLAGR